MQIKERYKQIGENMGNDTLDFVIEKLIKLRIETEFQDRQRGKKRYVSKASAYQDLIKLLKEYYEQA